MLEKLILWFDQYANIIAVVGVSSFALLIASLIASPWLLARLPADYFSNPVKSDSGSVFQLLVSVVRTIAGLIFALLGVLMMITPGPGLVFLVLGLALCDFPGKHAVLVKLVSQPNVLTALNWLRQKADKPPFIEPTFQ